MASYGRRQSTRTSRTSRPSNYYAKPFSYRSSIGGPPEDVEDVDPPGFFPAIQYFTDATASLPREVQKHLTLLKETEGKQYAPSEVLTKLLDAVDRIPDPPASTANLPQPGFLGFSTTNSATASTSGSVIDGVQPTAIVAPTSAEIPITSNPDPHAAEREALYSQLQGTLREMVMILDEKNMVLSSANETLARQVARLDDAMPYIDDEISEETRLGSNTHWALPHMKDLRRAQGSGRSARDLQAAANLAAAAAVVHEGDIAATRSEVRREAMLAKRGRHMMVDSDFDDRHVGKRAGKAKRDKDGHGDGKGAVPAPKRRKVEKITERALSAALNGRLAGTARDESRDRGAVGRGKKTATSQTAVSRKRGAASSPSLAAASPTRGTFSTIPKEHSPAPTMQRGPSSRGRQNSTQSATNDNSRNRPSSAASNKRGLGASNNASDVKKSAPPQSRFAGDNGVDNVDTFGSESMNAPEQLPNANGQTATTMQRSNSQAFKREETEPVDGDDRTRSANGSNIGTDSRQIRGRTSKPATPVNVSDDAKERSKEGVQASRVRNARSVNTAAAASSPVRSPQPSPKRPQRKAATANARKSSVDAEAAKEGPDRGGPPIDGDGEEENDENEPRYCICGGVSYGDMIACDNDQCPHEWFHLECVGLSRPPTSRQWYCSDDCRQVARSKR